jgi:hypothetical protein
MSPFREWSFARVLLVCFGWILLWIVVVFVSLLVTLHGTAPPDTGSGGLGAVSVGIAEFFIWLLFAPIPILLVSWSIARLRSKRQPATGC